MPHDSLAERGLALAHVCQSGPSAWSERVSVSRTAADRARLLSAARERARFDVNGPTYVSRDRDARHWPNSGRCPSAYSCVAWHIRSNSVAAMIAHSTASFRYQDEPNAESGRLAVVSSAALAACISSGSGVRDDHGVGEADRSGPGPRASGPVWASAVSMPTGRRGHFIRIQGRPDAHHAVRGQGSRQSHLSTPSMHCRTLSRILTRRTGHGRGRIARTRSS